MKMIKPIKAVNWFCIIGSAVMFFVDIISAYGGVRIKNYKMIGHDLVYAALMLVVFYLSLVNRRSLVKAEKEVNLLDEFGQGG